MFLALSFCGSLHHFAATTALMQMLRGNLEALPRPLKGVVCCAAVASSSHVSALIPVGILSWASSDIESIMVRVCVDLPEFRAGSAVTANPFTTNYTVLSAKPKSSPHCRQPSTAGI
ncbi:hypothetical protein BT67DRAFT_60719 [Trichocladium antarcticum]|uniref:Secreted protein n=1 Tax=Trichocladium antarcticum TaxID=1450529 RepID=A0AAN6ZDA5_9PEZI|nr:hypothetical protein BT67DRAFT_60719 [Trichocladium antarcticum]